MLPESLQCSNKPHTILRFHQNILTEWFLAFYIIARRCTRETVSLSLHFKAWDFYSLFHSTDGFVGNCFTILCAMDGWMDGMYVQCTFIFLRTFYTVKFLYIYTDIKYKKSSVYHRWLVVFRN